MLVQGSGNFVQIKSTGRGARARELNEILVSLNVSGSKKNGEVSKCIRISIPQSIAKAVGFVAKDRVKIYYTQGVCRLERTNERSSTYGVCGQKNGVYITFLAGDAIAVFFPNSNHRYCSASYEARPNVLDFLVGESVQPKA